MRSASAPDLRPCTGHHTAVPVLRVKEYKRPCRDDVYVALANSGCQRAGWKGWMLGSMELLHLPLGMDGPCVLVRFTKYTVCSWGDQTGCFLRAMLCRHHMPADIIDRSECHAWEGYDQYKSKAFLLVGLRLHSCSGLAELVSLFHAVSYAGPLWGSMPAA
eukprot:534894-Pelagomonas_calceolata.AAC.6